MTETLPTLRKRSSEHEYSAARAAGASATTLAARMDLSVTTARIFERAYRIQTGPSKTFDSSCPKFANHERHLKTVWRTGGFPALSERRGVMDRVSAVLPVCWPKQMAEGVSA